MLNYCTGIKIRAERAAGRMLRETLKEGNPNCRTTPTVTLASLGISRDQSSEWQKMAGMPDEPFERWMAEAEGMGEKITMAGLKEAIKQTRRIEKEHVERRKNRNEPVGFEVLRKLAIKMLNIGLRELKEANHSALDAAKTGAYCRLQEDESRAKFSECSTIHCRD